MVFNATYYPVPTVNQTTDLLEIFKFTAISATDGLMFPILILTIFVVQFIGVISEGRQASRGFIFASFTAAILAIPLGILALLEQKWIYILILMLSYGLFWIKLQNARE